MMVPTVHLNGTSREELLQQAMAATDKILEAMEVLSCAMPHGRDYYPQGPDALSRAQAEHKSRIERLDSVLSETRDLASLIAG